MKEVKNKFKERDEMETYFQDAKKKSFPIGILFVLLILIVIGGCAYYYFVIDSPKNIFLTALNKLSSNIEIDYTEYNKANMNFSLDLNLITNKKDYIDLTNVINEISFEGYSGINSKTKEVSLNILAKYEEKDLFGITGYYNKDTMYMKLLNIYDKVLKFKPSEEDIEGMDKTLNLSNETESIKIVINSISKHLINTFEETEYTKEYVELDETLVKKISFSIDNTLIESFLNKLLNDKEFLENYSKLEGITETKLKGQISKEIDNLKDEPTCEVSLYLSVLKNEFIKLEMNEEDIRIVITNEKNEIGYKYYESSIIKYQGFIMIKEKDNNYQISLSLEDIEQELTVELNSEISFDFNKEIETLDTTNAIDIESLTETDYNKIMENISNNEVLNDLYVDMYSLFAIYTEEDNTIQTT